MTNIELECRSAWMVANVHYDYRERTGRDWHAGPGLASRTQAARAAHRGNDPRAGIRAYCAGNVWLTENAKAVGNW